MSFHFLRWRNWGIGARLIFTTLLPVVLLLATVVLNFFQSRIDDARIELKENGRIIATALATSSEYSLVSGNFSDIKLLINGLILADDCITQIEIVNADRKLQVHVVSKEPRNMNNFNVEAPIYKTQMRFDVFDESGQPQVSDTPLSMEEIYQSGSKPVIGYVRVTMSESNMLLKQNQWLVLQARNLLGAVIGCVLITLLLTRSLTKPLLVSIRALNQIKSGDNAVQIPITTGGEIGNLQASINEMSISLGQAKQTLERKIYERTRDLQESRNAAEKSGEEKRRLLQQVHLIVEDERKSIAIEIHDELNSSLIAARLNSERILAIVAKMSTCPELEEIKAKGVAICELVRHLYVSSRNIVRKLRPEMLDMLGLSGAIEEIVRQYNQTHPDCRFFFFSEGDFSSLGSDVSIAAYRLVQEALSNIVKHSKATSASASLLLDVAQQCIHITVTDNGIGFDTTDAYGMGIVGMRERVVAFGGTIDLVSKPGEHTTYTVMFPLGPRGFVDRRKTSRRS